MYIAILHQFLPRKKCLVSFWIYLAKIEKMFPLVFKERNFVDSLKIRFHKSPSFGTFEHLEEKGTCGTDKLSNLGKKKNRT